MGAGKVGRVEAFERGVSPQVPLDPVPFTAQFAFELPLAYKKRRTINKVIDKERMRRCVL